MTTHNNNFGAGAAQMTLIGLRYLSARKLRTALTTLAIVFGVALIFAINLVLPSALSAFQLSLSAVSGADIHITSTSGEAFAPETVLPSLTALDSVRAATGILSRQFSLPGLTADTAAQITLIGIDPAQTVRQFAVSEGRFLQEGDTGVAVFPAGIAELAPELAVGTTFPLVTAGGLKLYTIVGFLAEQGNPSAPEIYVSLPDAQSALNQPALINTLELALVAGADRDASSASILQTLGDGFQLNAPAGSSSILGALEIGLALFNLLGLLALFLGAFLIFNTFRTVVIERRHDIAMLRAIGATQRQITQMIVIESLVQGVVGTIIGLVFGFLMAWAGVALMGGIWETYLNRGTLSLEVNLSAVVAGYLPARSAGRTSPLEALRPATPASVQHAARWSLIVGMGTMLLSVGLLLFTDSNGAATGALLFLTGMLIAAPSLVLPVARLFSPLLTLWFAREGDLARGNLVRQPGRAAITASTLMIGLATLILMAALVISFGDLVRKLADVNFSSDILILPPTIAVYDAVVGADPALAERVRALPEVATVGTLRYAAASTPVTDLQVLGIDPVDYPQVASFEFAGGDAESIFAALGSGHNAILTSIALSTLNLAVGDDLVLQTPTGLQTYRIAAVGNDILSFKVAAMFISQDNLAADFHKAEDVLLMVSLVPGADNAAALAGVQTILGDYPQFTGQLTGAYREELVNVTAGALDLFYGLAILILIPAALGLLNTLTINILERTREIGVVRAVGGSRGQVRRIVTAEALLLGIFGAAMGVFAGVVMSYGFILAFGAVGWEMPYTFPVMGVIAAVVIGVLLALGASILPARSAAQLDIVRALQYE